MTNVVAGVGVLATTGLQVAKTIGCEDKQVDTKQEGSKKQADFTTNICPIYPYFFHGSYMSYYVMDQGTPCSNPHSYDSATPLPCGCNAACFPAFVDAKQRAAATNCDGTGKVDPKLAVDGVVDWPNAELPNAGAAISLRGDVSITHNTKTIWFRLFEVVVDPLTFDPTLTPAAAFKPITTRIGHRIKPPTTPIPNRFGPVTNISPIAGRALCITTNDGTTVRNFTVVLHKNDN
jgi:hypothetical protein